MGAAVRSGTAATRGPRSEENEKGLEKWHGYEGQPATYTKV